MKKMTRVLYLALLMVGFCLRAVMPFVLYPLLAVGFYIGLQWLLPISTALAVACVLFGFVGTLVVATRTKLRAMPTGQSVRRRLEEDSGLPHQPLTALTDTPIDTRHMPIWRQHQKRMRASLASARYRLRMPSLDLGGLDPYGLRFFVAVLVLVALLVVQDKDESVASTAEVPLAELWLEPPAYLHHPPSPVLLTGNGRDRTRVVTVPEGSTLNVVQTPHRRQPVLWVNDEKQVLRRNEAQQWQLALALYRKKNGEAVRIGFCNSGQEGQTCKDATWLVQLVVDTPPEVYLSMPEVQASSLSLPYAAVDDDAVVRVRLALTLPDKDNNAHIARRHDLSVLSSFVVSPESLFSQERAVAGAWQRDLSHHPFAGLSVAVVAFAVDSARVQSASAPQTTVVPQRVFRDETAKKIVAARKALFWTDGDLSVLRNEFETLAGTLTDEAKARLALKRAIGAIPPNHDNVRGLLASADAAWQAALLLEDPSGFDNALYQLQRALDDYAAADESNREQAREKLAQALDAYNERSQQAQSGGEDSGGLGELGESVDTQALQQALDRQEQQRREQEQQDYVRHLQELKEQQEQLMGETDTSAKGTGEQQEALAESWRAPPITSQSEALTDHIRGQQAMRDAGESLRRAEPEQAREQQGEALGALERLLESTMREMAQSAARGAARGTARSEQRDPLGRILLRDPHDPRVRVPKDGQKTPASRVADKLRDALRSPQLAPQTKDYLERLLEP